MLKTSNVMLAGVIPVQMRIRSCIRNVVANPFALSVSRNKYYI
jgi:hypothetical protein